MTWPSECSQYNMVFDAFNGLIDDAFLVGDSTLPKYVRLMLPHQRTDKLKELHESFLEGKVGRSYGDAKLHSYDLATGSMKMELFSGLLMTVDAPLIGGARRR